MKKPLSLQELKLAVSAWRDRLAPVEDRGSELIAQSRERVFRSRDLLARTRRMLGIKRSRGPDET